MTLQQKVREDMTQAMKAKEEVRLRVLRSLLTLFMQELTATKRTPQDMLSDEEVLTLIKRSVKQRTEAALQFRNGGREDLAQNEDEEAKVLTTYLPEQMSKEEIETVVRSVMEKMGVTDKSGMGKLMGAVMAEIKNRADGKDVKEVLESILQ